MVSDPVDTFLNVVVFVYIGLMIWLYQKPERRPDDSDNDDTRRE